MPVSTTVLQPRRGPDKVRWRLPASYRFDLPRAPAAEWVV